MIALLACLLALAQHSLPQLYSPSLKYQRAFAQIAVDSSNLLYWYFFPWIPFPYLGPFPSLFHCEVGQDRSSTLHATPAPALSFLHLPSLPVRDKTKLVPQSKSPYNPGLEPQLGNHPSCRHFTASLDHASGDQTFLPALSAC
jgi:hypothetical protein